MSRSALLFLVITLLLSVSVVPSQSRSIPTEHHCVDSDALELLLAGLCFNLDSTILTTDELQKESVKRLLRSESGHRLIRYCSPFLLSPDSLLRKELKYVDASDLADKLQTKQLCDKPAACGELVRALFTNSTTEVRASDFEYLMRDFAPVCPKKTRTALSPTTTMSQSQSNNDTMALSRQNNMAPKSSEAPVPAVVRAPTTSTAVSTNHRAPALAPTTSHGSKLTVATFLLLVLFAIGFRCMV